MRTRLDKTENRIKDGSEQINEMINELKEKQNKVDEEYQRIFQMRQEYEQTVVEIKKVKDDALRDYRKILDKVRR